MSDIEEHTKKEFIISVPKWVKVKVIQTIKDWKECNEVREVELEEYIKFIEEWLKTFDEFFLLNKSK